MSCQAIVGTPPTLLIRSRSISSKARTGSHLRIITILAPANRLGLRIAKQPVAWKKGTLIREARCGALGSGAGGASPRRRNERAAEAPWAMLLELTFRWLAIAPFGFPVVPEV